MNNDNTPRTESERPTQRSERPALQAAKPIFEWVELFALSVCFVLLFLVLIARHSPVDGESMRETLQDEDLLIISNLFYMPERGDIIVFENTSTGYDRPYVKRVIAIAGDTISINEQEKQVILNGEVLDEPYAEYDLVDNASFSRGPFFNDKDSYTLKEGEMFVLGDNRCNSRDSRTIGPVDVRSVIGHVILRVYPANVFGTVD